MLEELGGSNSICGYNRQMTFWDRTLLQLEWGRGEKREVDTGEGGRGIWKICGFPSFPRIIFARYSSSFLSLHLPKPELLSLSMLNVKSACQDHQIYCGHLCLSCCLNFNYLVTITLKTCCFHTTT